MPNVFLLYMPPGNPEAMLHYNQTIHSKVPLERIAPHVPRNVVRDLESLFADHRMAVWGSKDGTQNRNRFNQMRPGDDVLIVEGDTIRFIGKIATKVVSPELSRELWQNLTPGETAGWDLIYFIANPVELSVPFRDFKELFDYDPHYTLRGFTNVSTEKLQQFHALHDDLYSIMLRLHGGELISKRPTKLPVPQPPEETEAAVLSEHLEMQWRLLRMGSKAGQRVWAPRSDQSRIASTYQFQEFEPTFAAGLDAQVKYVENIDVVWKQEFRIDAAFEIENSTSIYSGLLRFSDLTTVAPNSRYPLFIVAPAERRERVWDQLVRPTFQASGLSRKVLFLTYESVREIDAFFGSNNRGLTTEVLVGRAEKLAA